MTRNEIASSLLAVTMECQEKQLSVSMMVTTEKINIWQNGNFEVVFDVEFWDNEPEFINEKYTKTINYLKNLLS